MANLTEVQMALKQGDKAKATQILKTVLHNNPSADAWVMAARMTSNPDTAKQHLQRALAFNPKHVKARDMLRDLGVTPMSTSGAIASGLLPALQSELEKFGENKPLLKKFTPQQRMITALSLFSGILVLMIAMLSALLSEPPAFVLPEITPVTVYTSDTLTNDWAAAGLDISNIKHVAQTEHALSTDEITLIITDESGSHLITVFLYKDVAGTVNDGHRMTTLIADGKHKLVFQETAIILYPAVMNEATVDLLLSSLNQPSSAAAV